jgi:hypothetical protein
MDALEFILILAVFAVVLHWYLKNARAKSDGLLGLLALKEDPPRARGEGRQSYRVRLRARDEKAGLRDSRIDGPAKTYRAHEDGGRTGPRYHRKDGARYRRVKDIAST